MHPADDAWCRWMARRGVMSYSGAKDALERYQQLLREAENAPAQETRADLWDPFGNDGMRHMESADVTGGATYMVGRCIHGTKHTDGDGCPHCQR